jgi:preprotein translocase subunit SecB
LLGQFRKFGGTNRSELGVAFQVNAITLTGLSLEPQAQPNCLRGDALKAINRVYENAVRPTDPDAFQQVLTNITTNSGNFKAQSFSDNHSRHGWSVCVDRKGASV